MIGRRVLLGGVAAAALGGGVWLARREGSGGGEGDAAPADLWSQRFETPEGGTLAMADLRGRPLLINFWATWCAPCAREMPQLDRFHKQFSSNGWQVLGLAIDGATPVRVFLAKLPVSFAIGLAGYGGTELSKALGNAQGGLPFTVALDAAGAIVRRKLGETSYDELAGWVQSAR